MKTELSEKVHSENVKCYRNIQTLIEELEQKLDSLDREDHSLRVAKGYFGSLILLSIVNIIGVVVVLAHMFGFI